MTGHDWRTVYPATPGSRVVPMARDGSSKRSAANPARKSQGTPARKPEAKAAKSAKATKGAKASPSTKAAKAVKSVKSAKTSTSAGAAKRRGAAPPAKAAKAAKVTKGRSSGQPAKPAKVKSAAKAVKAANTPGTAKGNATAKPSKAASKGSAVVNATTRAKPKATPREPTVTAATRATSESPRAAPGPSAAAPSPARPSRNPAGRGASGDRAIVPDTSVLIDGRVTLMMQRSEIGHARILIPRAVAAELEHQANMGRESGFNGLDEIVKIQELKDVADCTVEFVGDRPAGQEIRHAESGEIDAMIRAVAEENRGLLLTSDRVQAHVARAMGIDVEYVRPVTEPEDKEADIGSLEIHDYFDDETMSVHLKYNVVPFAKKGTPGHLALVPLSDTPMPLKTLTRMRREIIEAARRDADSFIEIEREGATVVQLGPMRVAIAQPPFSDGLEITVVRPVTKLDLDAYNLKPEIRERLTSHSRGVFVSGPPGSGKSTFVTAVAEWFDSMDTVVKTMESPRDLQVSDSITQYGPLDGDMALTSDVLLLVRPDYVVYDEVRRTNDFLIFADMRLAGVGLIGVTHANRAIDAVQRLIGRVELGMIPQVVDTVIHIDGGKIRQILDLSFTVKTPAGMTESDLARPVIEVRDFLTGSVTHEIYTYGEQVVVMPVAATAGGGESARDRLAARELRRVLRSYVDGPLDVAIKGDSSAALYVLQKEIPRLIGKAGATVKQLEAEVGIKLDIRPLETLRKERKRGDHDDHDDRDHRGGRGDRHSRDDRPGRGWSEGRHEAPATRHGRGRSEGPRYADDDEDEDQDAFSRDVTPPEDRYAEVRPEIRKTKKYIALLFSRELGGREVVVVVDDEELFTATVGNKGDLRIQRRTDEGQILADALAQGGIVTARV